MPSAHQLIKSTYRDSVSLMQMSAILGKTDGITQAACVMATPGNLAQLRAAGLLAQAVEAGPGDLLLVVEGSTDDAVAAALAAARERLDAQRPAADTGTAAARGPLSIEMALEASPEANLALVSVPGDYAAAEAEKALRLGLNVMLFSDNVPVESEVALKRLAGERGLLVMGPDCGTAIIAGVPLGFANEVRRGPVGCIGASGTGLQEVSTLVDRLGCGISQVIGTGSRDLSEEVGGITMLRALDVLAEDPATRVLVLVSKPPAASVAERVLARAAAAGKPVVVCFLGAGGMDLPGGNLHAARTLDEAAQTAVRLATGGAGGGLPESDTPADAPPPGAGQRYIRGLYSGGTFCYEASLLLGDSLDNAWSNASVRPDRRLDDARASREHTLVDLGEDAFTRGRPHPMIDFGVRKERLLAEAADPEVGVILLDVVLGHGAHPDPASELVPAIAAAQSAASRDGRRIAFVAFVSGTPGDPQDIARQQSALSRAGVLLAHSNAQAVRLACAIASRAASASPAGARA